MGGWGIEGMVPPCARGNGLGRDGGWERRGERRGVEGVLMGGMVARRIEGMGPRIREETDWGGGSFMGGGGSGFRVRADGEGRGRGVAVYASARGRAPPS